MKQKQINEAIAKLHLENGDSLIMDARVFDFSNFKLSNDGARNCRLFPVVPNIGETVRDSFLVMHAEEMESLTRQKLLEILNSLSTAQNFPLSIIDGIEKDFCQCVEGGCICSGIIQRDDCHGHPPFREHITRDGRRDGPCAIHERCAVLRNLIKESNATH